MKKNLVLAFFSLLFTLILMEGVLRLALPPAQRNPDQKPVWVEVPEKKWVAYHPVLGWYPQKNKTALLETSFTHAEIHTNSEGMRGVRDYALEKPAGKTRVMALGDSFTFGFGVKDEDVYTRQLEDAYPNLEVPNFGVAGYGIDQVLMLYREIAKKYKTDYVLIGVFPEMFWRATRAFTAGGYAKPYFEVSEKGKLLLRNVPVPEPYQLSTNQFPVLFKFNIFENILRQSILYRQVQERSLRLIRKLNLIDPDMSQEWLIGRKILSQLVREIRESGAQPVLMIVPPEYWVRSPEKNQPRRSLLRFAKRNKLPLLDLTSAFYEAGKQSSVTDYYIDGDWHWSTKGHALAAHEAGNFLEKLGMKK